MPPRPAPARSRNRDRSSGYARFGSCSFATIILFLVLHNRSRSLSGETIENECDNDSAAATALRINSRDRRESGYRPAVAFTSGCVQAVSTSPATLAFGFGLEEMIFART